MIGLYQILNTTDGKKYFGSSCNIERRLKDHKYLLRTNKHHNIRLQRAWNRDGESSFLFDVLEEVDLDNLKSAEQELLNIAVNCPDKHYNISIDAEAPTRGRKMSEETKGKLKELRSTKEWKERQSASTKKHFANNPEARKSLSESTKAFLSNPENKQRMRDASVLAKQAPEVRSKLSAARKGKKNTEESNIKRSRSCKAMHANPEIKRKQVEALAKPEVKEKMVNARTEYFSDPDRRAKASERTKAFFANPENRKAASLRQLEYLKKKSA